MTDPRAESSSGASVVSLSDCLSAFEKRDIVKKSIGAALIGISEFEIGRKISHCMERFQVFKCTEAKHTKVLQKSCHIRICPHCESRRSRRLGKRVLRLYKLMKTPKFITLTWGAVVPLSAADQQFLQSCNIEQVCDDPWAFPLSDALNDLIKAFRKFRTLPAYKRLCRGGVAKIEIGYGKDGWTPHIHFLTDCKYWPVRELSRAWVSCGGAPVVWIETATKGVVRELCKYVAKATDLSYEKGLKRLNGHLLLELLRATKGRRLFIPVGDFFALERKEKKQEDDNPFVCPCGCNFELIGEVSWDEVTASKDRDGPLTFELKRNVEGSLVCGYFDARERSSR